jgi:hypothetical protein
MTSNGSVVRSEVHAAEALFFERRGEALGDRVVVAVTTRVARSAPCHSGQQYPMYSGGKPTVCSNGSQRSLGLGQSAALLQSRVQNLSLVSQYRVAMQDQPSRSVQMSPWQRGEQYCLSPVPLQTPSQLSTHGSPYPAVQAPSIHFMEVHCWSASHAPPSTARALQSPLSASQNSVVSHPHATHEASAAGIPQNTCWPPRHSYTVFRDSVHPGTQAFMTSPGSRLKGTSAQCPPAPSGARHSSSLLQVCVHRLSAYVVHCFEAHICGSF